MLGWLTAEFASFDLSDQRLTKRLIGFMEAISAYTRHISYITHAYGLVVYCLEF